MVIRGAFVALTALFLLASCSADSRVAAPAPGVVLISVDSVNERQLAGLIELLGLEAFEALRHDSLAFRRAYSHAPWTTPSHASMLSGLYPSQHGRNLPYGFLTRHPGSTERVETHLSLAERLGERDYQTAAFVGSGMLSARYGFDRGFESYREFPKNDENSDAAEVTRSFAEWIDNRREGPFFAFVHTFDVHPPLPGNVNVSRAIARVDSFVARIVEILKEAGEYDSSLIIFTSDHGSRMAHVKEKCARHGFGQYEENLRVPLFVKLPGSTARGYRDDLVRHVDLLPTVLDVVGIDPGDYGGPGVSIVDLEEGRETVEISLGEADGRCALRYSLVTKTHKYIYTPRSLLQLSLRDDPTFFSDCPEACDDLPPVEEIFDLVADPYEQSELSAAGSSPELERMLLFFREQMTEYLNLEPRFTRGLLTGDLPGHDEETMRSLRALGYVD